MCLHKHVHVRISPDNLARLTTWEGLKAEEGRAGWPGRRRIQSKDQNLGSEVKGSTESAGGTESTVYQPEGRKRTGLARK